MFGFAGGPFVGFGAGLVLVALLGSNLYTWTKAREQCQEESALAAAAATAKELELGRKYQADLDKAAEAAREVRVQEVERIKIVRKEVQRVIKEPVYRSCSVTPDGVRVYNAAASGVRLEDPTIPAQPVPPVPPPAATGSDAGGSAGGLDRSRRPVPRLPDKS